MSKKRISPARLGQLNDRPPLRRRCGDCDGEGVWAIVRTRFGRGRKLEEWVLCPTCTGRTFTLHHPVSGRPLTHEEAAKWIPSPTG